MRGVTRQRWLEGSCVRNRLYGYRGTSLRRNFFLLGPSSRPRFLRWSYGGGDVSYVRGTPVSVLVTSLGAPAQTYMGTSLIRKHPPP